MAELVTTGEAARRIGVSRIAVYYFVKNRKEELLEKGVLVDLGNKSRPRFLIDFEKYCDYLESARKVIKQRGGKKE